MPTNFPTSVDVLVNPTPTDSLNAPAHSTQHTNANDAIEAVESFLLGQTGNAWTAFTPTWTNLTVGNGTYNRAHYNLIGKTAIVEIDFVLGSTSAVTGDVTLTLPVLLARKTASSPGLFTLNFFDTGVSNYLGSSLAAAGDAKNWLLRASNAGATYTQLTALSSTIPFTWGTNDRIQFSATFEIA